MKAVKCEDGGSLGPKRKGAKTGINFETAPSLRDRISNKLYTPKSCGGLGLTRKEPRPPQQVHMGSTVSGNSKPPKAIDRSRIVTPKELDRQREKEARQKKRQDRRSMTREERKAAEQRAKDQRYAGPRFL